MCGCGCEAEWEADIVAEDAARGVDVGDVDQGPRPDFVAVEGLFIVAEAMWLALACAAVAPFALAVLLRDEVSGAFVEIVCRGAS